MKDGILADCIRVMLLLNTRRSRTPARLLMVRTTRSSWSRLSRWILHSCDHRLGRDVMDAHRRRDGRDREAEALMLRTRLNDLEEI